MKDSPTATALFFSEAEINLTRAGLSVERAAPEHLVVNMAGSRLCEVTSIGGFTYYRKDIATPEREAALDAVRDIVRVTAEYSRIMASAPPLVVRDLGEGYKLLADFNGTVLAGKETSRGARFVTWDWHFNREGLSHGHYYEENYEGAKRDFAIRSGLVEAGRVFTDEQLIEICRCCEDALSGAFELDDKQMSIIRGVNEQIRLHFPDIGDLIREQDAQREELQHGQQFTE